jgi:hypothetical protein
VLVVTGAVWHKDHAVLLIQVLDTHSEEFSFVPHSCVAHRDDECPGKVRGASCKPKLPLSVSSPHTFVFTTIEISTWRCAGAVEIEISGDEEVSQATKGDDSVTLIGRVK